MINAPHILCLITCCWIGSLPWATAQNLSGSLQTRAQFFQRDSSIGAFGTPQYDRQLYGAEAWVNLNYSYSGFDLKARLDVFNNSNLRDPNGSLSDEGLGMWSLHKKIDRLDITAGYIYDQIGSGIIYRAYEDRTQLIDNALLGVRLAYDIAEDWTIKGFTGRQRLLFDNYNPTIRGLAIDGFISDSTARWSLAPGIGAVARTYDDETMRGIISTIETYPDEDVFIPEHNSYALAVHNRLTAGNWSWYLEAALKSEDVQLNPQTGLLVGDKGTAIYTSLGYSKKGWALTLEAKRTEAFDFRVRPQEILNRGQIHFIPPLARENTYRLTTRYQPAVQFLGEIGFQGTLRLRPSRRLEWEINYANSWDLNDVLLYREFYTQGQYKWSRSVKTIAGIQYQQYNQERYEIKPGVPLVEAIVPFLELQYRISRKRTLRTELQYMHTDEDLGKWLWALVEYSIAPRWSFEISDMYNIGLEDNSVNPNSGLGEHFPTIGAVYTAKAHRVSLRYIRQVEGIVCSGGICRLEPAFSGLRLGIQTQF